MYAQEAGMWRILHPGEANGPGGMHSDFVYAGACGNGPILPVMPSQIAFSSKQDALSRLFERAEYKIK
jgi:hypothetical protein